MPQTSYYEAGTWDGQCDQCGRGFKFSALTKRWDNAWTCEACWEPRHPQDFVRAVRDNPSVPIARPRVGLPTGTAAFFSNYMNAPLLFTNSAGNVITWTES